MPDFEDYKAFQESKMSAASKANYTTRLETAAFGLCGEAGEFIDHLKKCKFHGDIVWGGHDIDTEYLKLELGDIMWYVACAMNAMNFTLEEVLDANVAKLNKRYAKQATTEESINRVETTHQPSANCPIVAEQTGYRCVLFNGHSGNCIPARQQTR